MAKQLKELEVRILICFHKMTRDACTVTNLAKILAVEKYTVSRAMTSLEQEGYIRRVQPRELLLTAHGQQAAAQYAERIDVIIGLLVHRGVQMEYAASDALSMAVHCSEETFHVIREEEERGRIRELMQEEKQFSGRTLCRRIRDGSYRFPFVFYRQQARERDPVSMANGGFEQPCTLTVNNGTGIVSLRTRPLIHPSMTTRQKMTGRAMTVEYFDGNSFLEAERAGHVHRFPAEALRFVRVGTEEQCFFHGSAGFRFRATVGDLHMPVSEAIFTIII